MESRSYNFSTAKKRSSQLASNVIRFPREEDTAPRTQILMKECPDQFSVFKKVYSVLFSVWQKTITTTPFVSLKRRNLTLVELLLSKGPTQMSLSSIDL